MVPSDGHLGLSHIWIIALFYADFNSSLVHFLWKVLSCFELNNCLEINRNKIENIGRGKQTFSKREPCRRDESGWSGSRMKLCGGERLVQEERNTSLIALIWRGWWTEHSTSALTLAHYPHTQLPDSQLSLQKEKRKKKKTDRHLLLVQETDAAFCCFVPTWCLPLLCRALLEEIREKQRVNFHQFTLFWI